MRTEGGLGPTPHKCPESTHLTLTKHNQGACVLPETFSIPLVCSFCHEQIKERFGEKRSFSVGAWSTLKGRDEMERR